MSKVIETLEEMESKALDMEIELIEFRRNLTNIRLHCLQLERENAELKHFPLQMVSSGAVIQKALSADNTQGQ